MQAVTSFPIRSAEPAWKAFVVLALLGGVVWVARHETRLAQDGQAIATLRAELDTVKGELSTLRAEVEALRQQTAGIAETLSASSGQLSAVDQQLARKIRSVEVKSDRNDAEHSAGLAEHSAGLEEMRVASGIPSARAALGPEPIAGNLVLDTSALSTCQAEFSMVDWGQLSTAAKAAFQAKPHACAEVARGMVDRRELGAYQAWLVCRAVEDSPRWDKHRGAAQDAFRRGASCSRALRELPP